MPLEINKKILTLSILLFPCFMNGQVQLELIPASQASVGQSTIIKAFIISNKEISGPARLQITVPNDWKAENYPGAFVDGNQDENVIKFSWFEFPYRDTVFVNALIDLPNNQEKGDYYIEAELDYIKDGKKMKLVTEPKKITLKKYFSRY